MTEEQFTYRGLPLARLTDSQFDDVYNAPPPALAGMGRGDEAMAALKALYAERIRRYTYGTMTVTSDA